MKIVYRDTIGFPPLINAGHNRTSTTRFCVLTPNPEVYSLSAHLCSYINHVLPGNVPVSESRLRTEGPKHPTTFLPVTWQVFMAVFTYRLN